MYPIEVSLVFLSVPRENEDIVDVHPYENHQVVSMDVIYDTSECRWRIAEAKGPNNPLEGPKLRVQWGLFDIFVMYSNLVEPTDEIFLPKDGGTPQCSQYGLDRRQGISISNSSDIQGSVVDTHTPFTIRFSHQQAARSIWT